jgi:predicted RNA binding protein YcfA (HicA-like mRNA interferase family)
VPSPRRFAEIRKELESAGFRLVRISGSHHVFERPGDPKLVVIPVHQGKVKPVYGRKIKQIVEGLRKPENQPSADN